MSFGGAYPLSPVRRRLLAIPGECPDDKGYDSCTDDIGCIVHKEERNQCDKDDDENHVYSIHSTRI